MKLSVHVLQDKSPHLQEHEASDHESEADTSIEVTSCIILRRDTSAVNTL